MRVTSFDASTNLSDGIVSVLPDEKRDVNKRFVSVTPNGNSVDDGLDANGDSTDFDIADGIVSVVPRGEKKRFVSVLPNGGSIDDGLDPYGDSTDFDLEGGIVSVVPRAA